MIPELRWSVPASLGSLPTEKYTNTEYAGKKIEYLFLYGKDVA